MATEDARKLFVAGLPESINEDVLRQLFEATGGSVVDVSLPKDRATGRLRGFGFVTMSTSDEATRARGELDGSVQAGRSISVRPFSSEPPRRGERTERSEPRAEGAPPAAGGGEDRTVYIGNLPYDGSQQELSELLNDAGAGGVARIHLPVSPEGRLRGFGFVTFQTAEAAAGAIAALRERDVRGRRLIVNIAHPRGTGGPGDRPRSPRSSESGGWSAEGPRFPTEPPMAFEGERRPRPPGEGTDWAEEAKKKKKKGAKGNTSSTKTTEERRRGGGSSWRSWDDDE